MSIPTLQAVINGPVKCPVESSFDKNLHGPWRALLHEIGLVVRDLQDQVDGMKELLEGEEEFWGEPGAQLEHLLQVIQEVPLSSELDEPANIKNVFYFLAYLEIVGKRLLALYNEFPLPDGAADFDDVAADELYRAVYLTVPQFLAKPVFSGFSKPAADN